MIWSLLAGACLGADLFAGDASKKPDQPWPRVIPCRIQDSENKDLWVMTLGDVRTPLADGTFDPSKDAVTLRDGGVKTNYFHDTLGIRFYQPMDKSRYPLPPSGWCTWYYYYSRINADEVKRNADWIAANLKDFGASYVQIDDGWQGLGGRDGGRDWTHVNPQRFPLGMVDLAAHIKSDGLIPGLWLAPHGQSNPQVVSNQPGTFLLKPDHTTASETWEGRYLLDATAPNAHQYMSNLFATLKGWGYEYFKIDGQPIVLDEYRAKKQFLTQPSDDAEALYRQTLDDIRSAIGPDRYLLGCWGMPIAGAGIMNGSRTGGDIVLGWGGFNVSLRATLQNYYLHNTVWYTDPDVLIVRPPLTLDQARVWASLQGLTGQALMSSDRLMDLPEDRVELLRRVYPAADIRPLDLFPVENNKRIWDLKIHHLDRDYDVVGVFNFNEGKSEQTLLNWKELGLPAGQRMHVFDFWNKEYLGAFGAGLAVKASPTSCRLLTLLPDNGRIELISTSRHITQGWVDLLALNRIGDGNGFKGTSRVVKEDPYELRFVFPPGTNYAVKSVVARGPSGKLPVKISDHQGWSTVSVTSPKTGEITWKVEFAPADYYHYPPGAPEGIFVKRVGLDGVEVGWREQYYLNNGYEVFLNGSLAGCTPEASFPLRGFDPLATNHLEVKAVWQDGIASQQAGRLNFSLAALLPAALPLTELEPVRSNARWRGAEADESLPEAPLNFRGKADHGLGAFANSEIEYDLRGLYEKFSTSAGVDDNSRPETTLEFVILGDGKELWHSHPLKKTDEPEPAEVDITGTHRLILRVTSPDENGRRRSRDQAGWAKPMLLRSAGGGDTRAAR